ncbi:MAG: 2-succinyl-6-hydroxy-2,4-cyclohexadiene-1-carboxylate synthase [Chlorobiaceae bacterium]|nr:2-succinyl-6-hydroxy-2,4-cyclohexadiene-1-carboxylate synthase [Chlorobiaceae bacterium]
MTYSTSQHPPLHLVTVGDSALPGILFLHGFLGSGRDWLPVARMLGERYCSLLVDLPGHGSAGMPERIDHAGFFMQTVDSLADLLRRQAPGPCGLAGYSMGGRIALALALRHPELFSSAVIVSASPGLPTEEERRLRRLGDDALARELEQDFDAFLGRWYDLPLFATLKADPSFDEMLASRRAGNPAALASCLRALGTGNQPSLWDELPGNRLPILFCAGEKDAKFVEIGRRMVNLCPGSALETFPGCGHTLHVEDRARFVGCLESFINNHRFS